MGEVSRSKRKGEESDDDKCRNTRRGSYIGYIYRCPVLYCMYLIGLSSITSQNKNGGHIGGL